MAMLTYVKGLPTPAEELNELGLTDFEMFLNAYCPIFHKAACETTNFIKSLAPAQVFTKHKSSWNTHLQQIYGISKRHANGIISFAAGAVDSASLCRAKYIKTLEIKLKFAQNCVKKHEKKLADSNKFYGFNVNPAKKIKKSKQ